MLKHNRSQGGGAANPWELSLEGFNSVECFPRSKRDSYRGRRQMFS